MKELLIHAGYGKTGTTWLQRRILPHLPDSMYLGKDPFSSRELEDLHNRLFPALYAVQRYRARNSALLLDAYATAIRTSLRGRSEAISRAVLSDECILDYANYNAELNMYLLEQMMRRLAGDLGGVKLLLTVRSQENLLLSYYAYDYGRIRTQHRSFNAFLDHGLANPGEGLFGGLRYDLVLTELRHLFGDGNVRFVPYEYLRDDPASFVREIEQFWGCPDALQEFAHSPAENVNQGPGGAHMLRDTSVGARTVSALASFYARHRRWVALPDALAAPLKRHVINAHERLSRVRIAGQVAIDDSARAKVVALYAESNRRFGKLSGVDVAALGYPV